MAWKVASAIGGKVWVTSWHIANDSIRHTVLQKCQREKGLSFVQYQKELSVINPVCLACWQNSLKLAQ